MIENISQAQPEEALTKPRKPWLKTALFSVLGLVLAGGLVFGGYWYGKNPKFIRQPVLTLTPPLVPSCVSCPQFVPRAPDFCPDGTIIPGEKDECGCQLPPKCDMPLEGLKIFRSKNQEYSSYTINYPKDWSFKEELAHGTGDLFVTFSNPLKKKSIVFQVSHRDFKENLSLLKDEYPGKFDELNIEEGKKGYVFSEIDDIMDAYYFPLKDGFYSLQLLDLDARWVLTTMLSTFRFLPSTDSTGSPQAGSGQGE